MKPLIVLHCDTIPALRNHENPKASLKQNDLSIDLEKMEKGSVRAVCFALFVDMGAVESPWAEANILHERFVRELEGHGDAIAQVRTKAEILGNDRLGAILTCEEGQIIEGNLSRLSTLRDWGVRIATLTWNYENDLASPNGKAGGLTDLGKDAVREMEQLGILVDVSHLGDRGISDVLDIARKPFIASHSNSRACTDHPRNLTDPMIRSIADIGGVVGLNFCSAFLSDDASDHVVIPNLVRHALHIRTVAGSAVLAIGSDFDGIGTPVDLPDISAMGRLWDALHDAGFSEAELDGIWQDNALRVLS